MEVLTLKNVACEPTSMSDHILDLVMCDKLDDGLVGVHVEPDYMAQKFLKMVNFKIKTNAENNIVKKISLMRKNSFNEDISIENVLHNIEMRKCRCQRGNHEERLICNDCVHCLTFIYNTKFKKEYEDMCLMITKKMNK